ncbi:MAG: hypothetical protein OEM52_14015 [bacterium]|nr:hypothetical protein [bacterium]
MRVNRLVTTSTFLMLLLLAMATTAPAQFGKNKVQYEYLNWESLQTKHFEIYFPDGGYEVAVATAEYAARLSPPREGSRLPTRTQRTNNDYHSPLP